MRRSQRQEPDPAEPEQRERVEVFRTAPQPPVQASRLGTARMTGRQRADLLPRGDGIARSTVPDEHRLVGGSQAARMGHAHDTATRDLPGEDDRACPGRPDHHAGRSGEIRSAVTGQPGLRRRIEAPHDPRTGDRPPELPTGPPDNKATGDGGGPRKDAGTRKNTGTRKSTGTRKDTGTSDDRGPRKDTGLLRNKRPKHPGRRMGKAAQHRQRRKQKHHARHGAPRRETPRPTLWTTAALA